MVFVINQGIGKEMFVAYILFLVSVYIYSLYDYRQEVKHHLKFNASLGIKNPSLKENLWFDIANKLLIITIFCFVIVGVSFAISRYI